MTLERRVVTRRAGELVELRSLPAGLMIIAETSRKEFGHVGELGPDRKGNPSRPIRVGTDHDGVGRAERNPMHDPAAPTEIEPEDLQAGFLHGLVGR